MAGEKLDRVLLRLVGGSDRFRKNFIHIFSANAIAQVISVITLPILSRIYSPADFGLLTTYTLLQSLILSFITGRIDWLVPNAKSPVRALRLIRLGYVISIALLCLVSVGIFFGRGLIAPALNLAEESKIFLILPIGIMAGAFQLLWQSWYIFTGSLSQVGKSKLIQALVTIFASLALGWTVLGGYALVIAYVFGFCAAAMVLFFGVDTKSKAQMQSKSSNAMHLLSHYKTQLFSSSALSVINVAMTMSLTFLLITFYSAQIVGWYGLVFRVATAPIGLLTTALVQSFWSDAALLAKTDPVELRSFYLSSVKRLTWLSIPIAAVTLCGPLYIPFVFGVEEWSGAGMLLMAVTPYIVGMIIFSPTTHLIVYGKAHWQLASDLLTFIVAVMVFSFAANAGHDAWVAIAAASTALFLGYILRFFIHLSANAHQINKNRISNLVE